MSGIWAWLALAALIVIGFAIRSKWKSSGRLGAAVAELKRLCGKVREHTSAAGDLEAWEQALSLLERYPNEYNKLNGDIEFIRAFAMFLERHYPEDERLEKLRVIGSYEKDSVWGFKIQKF